MERERAGMGLTPPDVTLREDNRVGLVRERSQSSCWKLSGADLFSVAWTHIHQSLRIGIRFILPLSCQIKEEGISAASTLQMCRWTQNVKMNTKRSNGIDLIPCLRLIAAFSNLISQNLSQDLKRKNNSGDTFSLISFKLPLFSSWSHGNYHEKGADSHSCY